MNASSSNNDSISRITMKFTWKPGGFNRYLQCQFKQSNTRRTYQRFAPGSKRGVPRAGTSFFGIFIFPTLHKSRFHPFVDSAVQGKFVYLHKLGNFPT
uniref:Uncharacterized protein n=1 Tax=Candidatus Kentrum sp. TC TaxID=2126339 RepID=A0A450Z9P0_9GAMM|nr:MAG: hypothetical protein BECKTC1821D_GA0114238_11072 [Candidatus Kentron sp. TC]